MNTTITIMIAKALQHSNRISAYSQNISNFENVYKQILKHAKNVLCYARHSSLKMMNHQCTVDLFDMMDNMETSINTFIESISPMLCYQYTVVSFCNRTKDASYSPSNNDAIRKILHEYTIVRDIMDRVLALKKGLLEIDLDTRVQMIDMCNDAYNRIRITPQMVSVSVTITSIAQLIYRMV